MACTNLCTSCSTFGKRGFQLVRYGGNFDNPSRTLFHVKAGDSVKTGDLLFTPAIGTQDLTVVTATGDYGVNGTDFLAGTALECANNETTKHFNFELQAIRDGHQYRIPMLNKAAFANQAAVDAYVGTRTLANFNSVTGAWTINNNLADAPANTFFVVGGNYADGYLIVEIVR